MKLRPSFSRRPFGRLAIFAGGFVLASAVAASAYWAVEVIYGPAGAARAQAASLSAPSNATVSESSATSVAIGWRTPATQLAGATYEVIRNPGENQVTVCDVVAGPCTDRGLEAGTAYTYSVIAVLDNWHSTSATATITTLGTRTSSAPDAVFGHPYSMDLAADGGEGGLSWTLAPSSSVLPPGLRMDGGEILGTPSAAGVFTGLRFEVTDSHGSFLVTPAISLTVTRAPVVVTASSSSTPYGSAPSVTASLSGLQNGQSVSDLTSAPTCTSSVTATSAVGNYPGANTCAGATSPDYSFSYVSAVATVT